MEFSVVSPDRFVGIPDHLSFSLVPLPRLSLVLCWSFFFGLHFMFARFDCQ